MKKTIDIILGIFLVTASSYSGWASNLKNAEPRVESPISNLWSWIELDAFDGMDIQCVTEDSSQNLWLATTGLLLNYDGYEINHLPFPKNFENSGTIGLLVTKSDDIWVYTTNGLLRYSKSKWSLIQRFTLPLLTNRPVIQETDEGIVYVMTPLGLYEFLDDQFTKIPNTEDHLLTLAQSANALWILKKDYVTRIPTVEGKINLNQKPKYYIIDGYIRPNKVYRIAANDEGEVVIISSLTKQEPLEFDSATDQFLPIGILDQFGDTAIRNATYFGKSGKTLLLLGDSQNLLKTSKGWKQLEIDSIKPSNSTCVFRRQNGNLIISGRNESVFEINTSGSRTKTFNELNFQFESENGALWFINVNGEVIEHQPGSSSWKTHKDPNIINAPVALLESSDGTIWVAGSHNGIAAVSYNNGTGWKLDIHPQLFSRISHLSPLELKDKSVIFGSGNEDLLDGGVVIYHYSTPNSWSKEFLTEPTVPDRIEATAQGSDGLYFAGTNLNRWTPGTNFEEIDIPGTSVRWIDTVCADSKGNIWAGSLDNTGVNKWDGKEWVSFRGKEYLKSDQIVHIAHDPLSEDLWITCRGGISKYSSKSNSWIPNALVDDFAFQRESGTLKFDKKGNLWINKSRRSWFFRSGEELKLTDERRKRFNTTRYTPDTHPPTVYFLTYPNETTEPANVFITWGGTDYFSITPQEDLHYSYQLNGGNWSNFASSTELILNDLKSGEYEIKIRSRDLDGNISKETPSMVFVVNPLLWRQPWFIAATIMIILTIAGLIALTIYLRIQNIIQLERFKSQFFTNMSHDLRTPLTVIMGPLESLLRSQLDNEQRASADMAYKNSRKIERMVDQLLEYRRLKLGKLERKYTHLNIVEWIDDVISSIKPLIDQHEQSLNITNSHSSFHAWFESDKLEHVIQNLLTNASNYTPARGVIDIKIEITENSESNPTLKCIVEDDGIGIPKQYLNKIFDPFVRIPATNKNHDNVKSSGIGLAFVKELIDSIEGRISVESPTKEQKKGTRFTIELPLRTSVSESEKVVESAPITEVAQLGELDQGSDEKLQILVTEDDADIRKYLTSQLSSFYSVIEAGNGSKGLEQANTHVPDIIISDAMMPEMDGFTFCEKIKASATTSHIPVLMLTALKADQHELKALQKGADDFISKPIQIEILLQKIKNQLHLRDEQHRKYEVQKAQGKFDGSNITSNRSDESFINKIVHLIEENYQDPKFDVETISGEMFMSRTTLYRKFKAITGESPSQFIKSLRMNKAVELLKNTTHTISEISDMVGYNDPSYLGATFKSLHGCTPKQFREKHVSEK